jgi:hypothetical protein
MILLFLGSIDLQGLAILLGLIFLLGWIFLRTSRRMYAALLKSSSTGTINALSWITSIVLTPATLALLFYLLFTMALNES